MSLAPLVLPSALLIKIGKQMTYSNKQRGKLSESLRLNHLSSRNSVTKKPHGCVHRALTIMKHHLPIEAALTLTKDKIIKDQGDKPT